MDTKNTLVFKISAGLKRVIGRDLITDDFVAIFELVKNAYDAHASEVEIIFSELNTPDAKIIIKDNGKGMNYQDLVDKWLVVAYSAKAEGEEDDDYRDKIQFQRHYAGAKGIGRFSCDRLGSKLKLTSIKDETNAISEVLEVNWNDFEQDAKREFTSINIQHSSFTMDTYNKSKGTILEITQLRAEDGWGEEKILKLKISLSKLINPFGEEANNQKFKINIKAIEYLNYDERQIESERKINGPVQNKLTELLSLKTTKITSRISEDGSEIHTELTNDGFLIYDIIEHNPFSSLKDVIYEVYYLNQSAKANFKRQMGLRAAEFASILVFKNGIRIFPYGEPGVDLLGLDERRIKRLGDFVGNNDLIGRIEINGDVGKNPVFIETSSRADGLVKNTAYRELIECFYQKIIERLETFRLNTDRFGFSIETLRNIESDSAAMLKLLASETMGDNIIRLKFNEDIINLLVVEQSNSKNAITFLENIAKIARDTNNSELGLYTKTIERKIENNLESLRKQDMEIRRQEQVLRENQKRNLELQSKIELQETQNLFLKSLRTNEMNDLVSLMHHIGISSDIISNRVADLSYRIEKKIFISPESILSFVKSISIENQKISAIARFATKANFRMNATDQNLDVIEFISEYVVNISAVHYGTLIKIHKKSKEFFLMNFRPLELIIALDNLISNSRKAKATIIDITLNKISHSHLEMSVRDNGLGVETELRDKLFDFGFTTTNGSGLGLTHTKDILERINATIKLGHALEKGTEFIVNFNK